MSTAVARNREQGGGEGGAAGEQGGQGGAGGLHMQSLKELAGLGEVNSPCSPFTRSARTAREEGRTNSSPTKFSDLSLSSRLSTRLCSHGDAVRWLLRSVQRKGQKLRARSVFDSGVLQVH